MTVARTVIAGGSCADADALTKYSVTVLIPVTMPSTLQPVGSSADSPISTDGVLVGVTPVTVIVLPELLVCALVDAKSMDADALRIAVISVPPVPMVRLLLMYKGIVFSVSICILDAVNSMLCPPAAYICNPS